MSFHIDYSFIFRQTIKTSALRDIYQLEIMEEEEDLDVCKCGIFTAVFDSRKIISVTLLQSAIFCSGMEVFFSAGPFLYTKRRSTLRNWHLKIPCQWHSDEWSSSYLFKVIHSGSSKPTLI